ncbi:MAG: hypothetical protein RB292_05300 [Patescibacteria group bacterium]|jgi:hypothetical protein|nr:hypothetical protein [Patescibacteria group bacterium]
MKRYQLITLLLITLFLTGCINNTSINQNTNEAVGTNQDTATTTNEVIPTQAGIQENNNPSTTTEEIDTSDWLTYRNEEYGFEFKYPGDWSLFVYKNDIIALSSGGHIINKDYPGEIIISMSSFQDKSLIDFHRSKGKYLYDDDFYNLLLISNNKIYKLDHIPDSQWPIIYILSVGNVFFEISVSYNNDEFVKKIIATLN